MAQKKTNKQKENQKQKKNECCQKLPVILLCFAHSINYGYYCYNYKCVNLFSFMSVATESDS